jgi:hypothetical protein
MAACTTLGAWLLLHYRSTALRGTEIAPGKPVGGGIGIGARIKKLGPRNSGVA